MPQIVIGDVPIDFPHSNPYTVQRTYMEKVVECLKDSKNGVLESPTGTGKTLSLLCASLGWLQQKKDEAEALQVNPVNVEASTNSESNEPSDTQSFEISNDSITVKIPKIIYASRTHTQLTQAIKELKGTSYNYMKVGVFASRDQLCIHPDLACESNATKTEMCTSKIKKDKRTLRCDCSFYEQYETLSKSKSFRTTNFGNNILDIEDLVTSGRKHHYCPYFMAKTMIDDADIVFMPYNYLLDPKIRNSIGVELRDAVVILDEAHNVPQVCEDSASIEFKSSHIADAITEVAKIANFINENRHDREFHPSTFNPNELNDLKNILIRFKSAIDGIQITRTGSRLAAAEFDGDYIFTIMENADVLTIAYHTSRNITLLIKNMLQYVSDCVAKLRTITLSESQLRLSNKNPGLRKFNEILWTTFANCGDDFREEIRRHYRVFTTYESHFGQPNESVKIVNYWCFSPKFALEYLLDRKQVRSIIFTSGTMSPLQPFITSLGITIEVRLQNSHIIDRSQVLVEIISHGPDNEQLFSNFDNRSNPRYLHSLGNTVLELSQVIPNGLLIFFPSYELLNMSKTEWQNKGIWNQIERSKRIFIEPKFKDEFTNTIKNYYKQINNETMNGAIFMAVCRGKVSEGVDFADINGRAVIITGIPFAPMFDPKIRLKKKYMQHNRTTTNESLSGDQWYQLEASRAVNQAIGRVIRHRHDYGAILLCDIRFNRPVQKSHLSQWIQRHIRIDQSPRSFDSIINRIENFFQVQQMASVQSSSGIVVVPQNFRTTQETTSELTEQPTSLPSAPLETAMASFGVASSIVVVSQNGQTTQEVTSELTEEPTILLQSHADAETLNDSIDDNHSTNSNQEIPESPTTAFVRQIASLPLSSPSVSTNNVNSNGTPSKQRCTMNLSNRFDEQN